MNADRRRWNLVALLLVAHAALATAIASADGFESSIADEIGRRLSMDKEDGNPSLAISFGFPYSQDVAHSGVTVGAVETDERSFTYERRGISFSAYQNHLDGNDDRWKSIDFGLSFSRYVSARRQRRYFRHPLEPIYRGVARLEEPEPLPQPTLVEMRIAKGFPSGDLGKPIAAQDDSYHLAEEEFTFGGLPFSR